MRKFFIAAFLLITFSLFAAFVFSPSIYVAPILMYHNIDNKSDMLSVTPENLDRQMKFLRDKRYNVVPLGELVNMIVGGKKIPANTVVVTFDDGRENNFTNAYPILRKYKIPAIMFVIPGHCGQDGYLSKSQIKHMSGNGIDIGSHTMNDVWLPSRDDKTIKEEITFSKKALGDITGRSADFFCYPLGGFDERVRTAVMRAGYKGACATTTANIRVSNDIYSLKRIKISGNASGSLLKFWFNTSGYAVWWKEHKLKRKIN